MDADQGWIEELLPLVQGLSESQIIELVNDLPQSSAEALLEVVNAQQVGIEMPKTPAEQALEVDPKYTLRPHLQYLSDRLAQAVQDVENGQNRMLTVSMPPRSGKSILTSLYLPLWLQRIHPEWKIGMLSHDDSLVQGWAGQIRQIIEERDDFGIRLNRDHGATTKWETVEGGGLVARSIGASVTGLGFNVLLLDDVVKDFITAHSSTMRETIWDKWKSDLFTRLEGPYLVIAIGTRWHEDDFIGRLHSKEHEGNPEDWEKISFPAIAEEHDLLGREPGEPLYTPLVNETEEKALARWADVRESVGTYAWSALYQQKPAPSKGAIFDTSWWRYWTTDPNKVKEGDNTVVYFDPETELSNANWLDSWDAAFKGTDSSDFVVAQRWARKGANRYLITQKRGRWSFTQTIKEMESWIHGGIGARFVHKRLIEDKANGPAIIDTLKDKISGIQPVRPEISKEARARAITPECESRNVFLPHPDDPGNSWVEELLAELRNFPHDAHDDQADALTQALTGLRESVGIGSITVPGNVVRRPASSESGDPRRRGLMTRRIERNIAAAARTMSRIPGRI